LKILLDTHAVIWALEDSRRLSPRARSSVEDPRNEVIVSAASAIEIAIKISLGRLRAPEDLAAACDDAGFVCRALGFDEAAVLRSLPWHHRDPFDRLLVAHAIAERATLVTRDRELASYGVSVLW
jgi:PIN domain nuclease of toxin-antitoxin system